MSKTLPRWLKNKTIESLGGSYEGLIEDVNMQPVRNPFTTETADEPVITFADGYKLVPNIGIRRSLIEAFGPETENWRGREIAIRLSEVVTKRTGEVRLVKVVDLRAKWVDEHGDADHDDFEWRDPEEPVSSIAAKPDER